MRDQVTRLKPFLDDMYRRFHTVESLRHDPLSFPSRYDDPQDIEAAGMLASAFAFGRVAAFMPVVDRILGRLGPHPAAMLGEAGPDHLRKVADGIIYRFADPGHVEALLGGIGTVLRTDGSFEPLFMTGFRDAGTVGGLVSMAAGIRKGATTAGGEADPGFLVPLGNPDSPMKRMCMFLRWMVRDDGLDMGLWKGIKPSSLLFPLDVHVYRISGLLGLLPCPAPGVKPRAPRMKDSVLLTDSLRELDAADPVRYDFAMSHLGISGACRGTDASACRDCPLFKVCLAEHA